jgi:putative DNA primase/helicase
MSSKNTATKDDICHIFKQRPFVATIFCAFVYNLIKFVFIERIKGVDDHKNIVLKTAALGWKLMPVKARDKIPNLKKWQENSSSDPDAINSWLKSQPKCNWAVATGKISGVFVVDIDPRHDGHVTWGKLMRKNPPVTTVECATGGGGRHLYFNYNPKNPVQTRVNILPGIDIRSDNGLAVIPPSLHPSGKLYSWVRAPWENAIEDAPEWLMDIITANVENEHTQISEKLVEGNRNNSMFHQALTLFRQGATSEFVYATLITWRNSSDAMNLSDDEVAAVVKSANRKHENEKDKLVKIDSAKTDYDNAALLIKEYGDVIIHVNGLGWFVYDGHRWVPDSGDAMIMSSAISVMKALRDKALNEAMSGSDFRSNMALAGWANQSLNLSRLRAMIQIASTSSAVRKQVDELDNSQTSYLLNVRNGVVDLRTGSLAPHNPESLITKYVDTNYNADAECPFWLNTLELAFDHNTALIEFFQRAIGYSITGSITENAMFICWGEHGNNGKSTILETIARIFGPYMQMSDIRVITSATVDNRVDSSLAKLPGVRLVTMNEAEDSSKLSEALVKQLTGGDTIQACKKFHEPFEYIPQFKIWLRTNEKPIIRGISEAIWRRIKLIPFIKPIPPDLRLRREIVDEALEKEYEGILAWAIQGAIIWYKNKLIDPVEVVSATESYRSEMDIIATFISECLEFDDSYKIARIDLYQAFISWLKDNGFNVRISNMAFSNVIAKKLKSNARVRVDGKHGWEGIRLSPFTNTFS